VQRRVDRPLGQVEHAAASSLELLDDGVAVAGHVSNDREQQEVDVPLDEVSLHTKTV